MEWFPSDKNELNKILDKFLAGNQEIKTHVIIVPHAGYVFSGEIAGKAFSLLKHDKKAVVFGPSHYEGFEGIRVLADVETPLGTINIPKNNFLKINYEHSVINEIPFLQKLGFKEILPLVVGEINNDEAERIAKSFLNFDGVYVFSTDLSHFLSYDEAVKKDKKTIEIIENLDFKGFDKMDACGKYPLLIMMHLCKFKGWKPKLIEYKNSGDITGDKSSVVGYASFVF